MNELFTKIIFHPILAFFLFVTGMWMASEVDPLFGLLTILGGLLFGYSVSFNKGEEIKKKSKRLLYGSFMFFLILFSTTYIIIISELLL